MKQLSKRILALLCVSVMLFTCCLSGMTFAVSADTTTGGTTAFGNKWTIYYNESGLTLNYNAGGRFEKSFSGFNAQIPETYEMADISLYVHMTLDAAAVTAFEKGSSFELSQSTMDKSERNWSLASPEWKVGENIVLLPLSASGNAPGGADPFDLHKPINYFRAFANPGSAEFAAASSVTIYEIALVDTTTAGVTFGADDTYLMLSEPIKSTPNTIEASVKVDPIETEIALPITFSPRYETTKLESGEYAQTPVNMTVTGVEGIVDGTTAYGCTMPVGGYLGTDDKKFSVSVPKAYKKDDLALAFWFYTSTGTVPNTYMELTSSGKCDNQELEWTTNNMFTDLQVGWNYIEMPLSAATHNQNGGAFDLQKVNFLRFWGSGKATEEMTVYFADWKLVKLPDVEEEPEEEVPTEWSIGYPNGSRYIGSSFTKEGVYDAEGNTPAPYTVNIGTGVVGAGDTAPEGTRYYAVTVNKGGLFAMANQNFSVEFPATVTKNDLFLTFWMYTSTGEIPSGYLELTSAKKADTQEIAFDHRSFITNPQVGWNYVELPLAAPSSKDDDDGTAPFDYTNANFIRWVGGSSAMSAVTEIRISEMKFIAKTETVQENEQLLFPTAGLGSITWSDGSDGLPAGLPYVEMDLSANGGSSLVMNKTGLTVDVPENTNFNDMGLSFWLWVNDVDNISGVGQLELTSSGTCDQQELGFGLNKSKLKDGWNHVFMPFNTGSLYSGTQGVAFDHTAINYLRWYGLYGANLKVKFSHFSIYLVEEEENPTWPVMNTNVAPYSWDGGKFTAGNVWTNDGTEAAQPLDGTMYYEVTPGTGVKDIDGDGVNEAWKAGFTSTAGSFIIPNIPSYYEIEDLTFSFWVYAPDADLLVKSISDAPNFEFTSDGNRDGAEIYKTYLLRDGIQGEWKDGWNYIEMPFSAMTAKSTFDLYGINFMRWSHFVLYYSADENVADVVRFADFRITALTDKTPSKAEEVDVTTDDCIIVGNTNTADENPIALFTDVYGNVCWVWGDKQYTTDFNVCTGEWIDLALVRDMEEGLFILYADGEVVARRDATGTADIVPTVAFSIGADGLGETFKGMIADVRLWSDVRTADEIANNRVTKVGNKVNPLITAGTEGLIDAWYLVGNLNYVLGGTVLNSVNGNDLVFKGSRADDWEDYEIPTDVVGEDYYTMVFIPDTQELVTGAFTEEWMAAAQWIADNVENENIVHVIGAGDTTWLANDHNFTIAKNGWDLFTDKVSWSNMTGNHDYPGSTKNVNDTTYIIRDSSKYNEYFGIDYIKSTAAANTYCGSFADDYDIYGTEADENGKYVGMENSYYRFKVNGVQWMILQLEYHPRVSVINWANDILDQYPNDNVIFTTHGYIGDDTGRYSTHWMPYTRSDAEIGGYIGELMPSGAVAWPGGSEEPVWTEILYNHDNVKMLLCGHDGTSDGHVLTKLTENAAGNIVPQIMINAQDLDVEYFQGQALSMLGLLRFSADGTKCEIQYYSPYHDSSYHPSNQEMRSLTLTTKACAHEDTKVEGYVAPTCTTTGSTGTEICVDCGEVVKAAEELAALGHTPVTDEGKAPDCTNTGLTAGAHCSVCGEVLTAQEVIDALGHTEEVVKGYVATCTETGLTDGIKCSVCGTVIKAQEVIAALGHTPVIDEGKKPTCTETGLTEGSHCSVCGETLTAQEVIDALGHTEEVVKGYAATCTEAGLTDGIKCSVCGTVIKEQEVLDALGHTEVIDEAKAPTCTESGLKEGSHCSVCGEVLVAQDVIPALGHADGPHADGMWDAKHYCGNGCGLVMYDLQALLDQGGTVTLDRDVNANGPLTVSGTVVLELNGHKLYAGNDTVGDGVLYVPAGGDLTITGEGVINGAGNNNWNIAIWANGGKVTINGGTITNVGAPEGETYDLVYVKNGGEVIINGGTFEAKDPVWTLNSNDTAKGTFTVYGGTFYKYDPSDNTTENPTVVWVAEGYDVVANGDYNEVVVHVHDEGVIEGKVDATCTENGYTGDLVCRCGEILEKGEVIEAKGHDEGVLEGEKDATVGVPGYTGDLVCGVCGEILEKGEIIPALEAKMVDGVCYVDGERAYYAGLIVYEGDLYYIGDGARAVKGRFFVNNTNNLEGYARGCYYFDEDGKMLTNVVVDGYYYGENGLSASYGGLVKVGESYYYVIGNGAVATGRYCVSNTNNLADFTNGFYYFDETGAMVGTGVYEGYYYEDGKATPYAGMVTVGEDVYYVYANAMVRTGRYAIVNNNCFTKGIYYFGEDGKMMTNVVVDGYYYGEDGLSIAYRGLVKAADGNYYYVGDSGKVITNREYFVSKTNGHVAAGFYTFDEYGAMLLVDSYEELIAALANNSYISLAGDIVVNGNITLPAGATLNGNGYTLTGAQIYMGEGSTVTRTYFTGTASEQGSNIYAHSVSATVSFCVFDSPGYEAIQATTTVPNKTVTIHSNTFVDTADTAYRYVHVEITDAALRGDAANGYKLVLTNNYFVNIDSCDEDGISVCGVLPENLTVSGNRASAASEEAAKAECWFGERTSGAWVQYDVDVFETIETAATVVETADELAAALAEGGEVKLAADVVLTDEPIVLAQDTVLDLGGKTLTGRSTAAAASNLITVPTGTTLTLKNGTVTFEAGNPDTDWGENGSKPYPGYANNTINCRGTLIVDGATILNTTAKGGASYAIDCYAGADLIVNSGLIDGGDKIAIRMFANSATTATSVTINGGTVQGYRAVWVQLPSSDEKVAPIANLTVNGGDLISTDTEYNQVVYVYSYGNSFNGTTVELNGGNYYGDVALGGGGKSGVKYGLETVTVDEANVKLYGEYGVYSYNDAADIEVLPNV